MICQHQKQCTSCHFLSEPIERQRAAKLDKVRSLLADSTAELKLLSGPSLHFRDRTDLTTFEDRIGFYDHDRQIFSLHQCPLFTSELQNVFHEFLQKPPDIKKGSVRLRSGCNKEKGLWLDFANVDIKKLLDEKSWLSHWLDAGFTVEMGQKRKQVKNLGGILKLTSATPQAWFSTRQGESEMPLKSFVSSFTQPSREWNQILIGTLLQELQPLPTLNWIELGSGIGNFTVPLLARGDSVVAVENDPWSIECLKLNTAQYSNLQIIDQDFTRWKAEDTKVNALLCDPPRSGLGGFTNVITGLKPEVFVYISCDLETWLKDVTGLGKTYRVKRAYLVDQFPHTPRVELLSILELR